MPYYASQSSAFDLCSQWTEKIHLEYEGTDYLRLKVLVDDDIFQEVRDNVVVKVDKGSVGPGKRISSVSGPVGLRDKGQFQTESVV
ncbi:hypothetical protein K2173_003116 [Erythroxylum novogranatense]|uniref:Uncharacterized protein n=1 Tax=Erythroxylum novogranatense TaxID=1862640 RepID=A0AAV8TBH9_9ROSI|nr:hypothetical protein K2173_003116 [Erythroxylum novogranatense]